MSENAELVELLEQLNSISDQLTDVETHMDPLVLKSLSDLSEECSHVDRAKLHAALAYTLHTLYFMYVKTQGVNVSSHPVKKELARVKQYIEKISAATKSGQKPKQRIDQAAAARFVRHALSGEETGK
eukprot:CAMPEP_0175158510 /NCGR_PEP_ID=MMETSP0087-20121206/22855_1 /TAXON_ID=136419 /ORGANISM="Unknown Unknown, Strain D1" /LENGTH=127 /DNA_ID=CAMNT_0016446353 /DNA_START=37 /DNA_END=420 /DNA_ORIENTATION=+